MPQFDLGGRLWRARAKIPSLAGTECQVYIMQEAETPPTARQLLCLERFAELPTSDVGADIAANALRYLGYIESVVDLESEGIKIDKSKIATHYSITTVLIPELRDCDSDFVFVSANCEWEREHGMQLLFENGKVIWCGDHSALAFGSQWTQVIATPTRERRREIIFEALK